MRYNRHPARNDFAVIVKKKFWQSNIRATTRGVPPGRVFVDNRLFVYCTDRELDSLPKDCQLLALVRDYGDAQKVRIFDKKGKQIKGVFHRFGRLGLKLF